MKIIQNNYINNYVEEDTIQEIICEHCNSVFEIDDDDIIRTDYDDEYVYCPCCNQRIYLYEPNTKDNINFPTSYHAFENGVDITDEEINKWVRECVEWLEKNPEEPYKYIGSGNTFVIVFSHEDEYYIVVTKNYFDTSIDK